ncbi:MAG: hypothetical protein IIY21_14520 [Clostridiales bacterium]|nr:hypothetical protein [Clostridiales bacterium]
MRLSDRTFAEAVDALHQAYTSWELPDTSITTWKNVLALSISDELLPAVILDWVMTVTTPPKNPAEIIKHANEMVRNEYDGADTAAQILIDSARNAYYATDDFLTFADEYSGSFASMLGQPAQEAYVIHNIRQQATSPNILILVYDELKGELKDCFTGDAEHGVDFLRTHIKKTWNAKSTDTAKQFLISGKTEFKRLTDGGYGQLEA